MYKADPTSPTPDELAAGSAEIDVLRAAEMMLKLGYPAMHPDVDRARTCWEAFGW